MEDAPFVLPREDLVGRLGEAAFAARAPQLLHPIQLHQVGNKERALPVLGAEGAELHSI